MNKIKFAAHAAAVFFAGQLLGSALAFADVPTPTPTATPTATSTPSACMEFQQCVDTSVPTAVSTCATDNAMCTVADTGKYAITPGILAERAVALKDCASRKTKFSCRACYESAKIPLAFRFDIKLFHGLIAAAVKDIGVVEQANCSALKK